jgi:hypothetical protein
MWTHVLVAILSIVFLVGVGIGSYALIQSLFKAETSIMEVDNNKQLIAVDVTKDNQAVNLIYEVHNDKIIQVLIEILNSDIHNMDYISVPGNTDLKLSADVEKKLEKYDIDIKENSIRVDELTKEYSSNAFQFGQIIIGDVLGIDISHYTVIEKEDYVKYFVTDDREFYLGNKKHSYEVQVLSETFKTRLRQFDVDLNQIIEDAYEDMLTNLHINNKKAYISKFEQIDVDKIYNWHLIGKEQYGRFVIDEDGTAKLINFLVNNKNKYKYTQEEYNSRKAEQLRK